MVFGQTSLFGVCCGFMSPQLKTKLDIFLAKNPHKYLLKGCQVLSFVNRPTSKLSKKLKFTIMLWMFWKTFYNNSDCFWHRKIDFCFFDNSALCQFRNSILFLTLFWQNVRKSCSSDLEKLLKFETEGQQFVNILRFLEQNVQIVKEQFWKQNAFLTCSWKCLSYNRLEQFEFRLEKNIWNLETCRKS